MFDASSPGGFAPLGPRNRTLVNWQAVTTLLFIFGAGVGLLAWTGARVLVGDEVYFAILMAFWYSPLLLLLKRFKVGMDWVEESFFSHPKAALLGALIGATYCGLPASLVFTTSNAVSVAVGDPSAFARTMSLIAVGMVLPGSVVIGALWGALLGQDQSTMRLKKWRVRVLTENDAEAQQQVIQSVLGKYRTRGHRSRPKGGAQVAESSIPVRDPELGEAIVADLGRSGINAEVQVVECLEPIAGN
jgi:hypothetical protein